MTDLEFVDLLDSGVNIKLSTPRISQAIRIASAALYKGAAVRIDNTGRNFVVVAVAGADTGVQDEFAQPPVRSTQ